MDHVIFNCCSTAVRPCLDSFTRAGRRPCVVLSKKFIPLDESSGPAGAEIHSTSHVCEGVILNRQVGTGISVVEENCIGSMLRKGGVLNGERRITTPHYQIVVRGD